MQAPDFSADLYRDVTEFAQGTPSWVHEVADVGTDAGLLLFAVLFVAGWWRARAWTRGRWGWRWRRRSRWCRRIW